MDKDLYLRPAYRAASGYFKNYRSNVNYQDAQIQLAHIQTKLLVEILETLQQLKEELSNK